MADNDVTRIAGNIGAMNALYSLQNINKQLSIHQTRLATGKRINSAADDPAGLAISTKMLARSEGLKTALSNIGDAKNLLAVAESGLGRLTDILNSMRNITENAANDTNGTEERAIVKEQLASYAQQIDDIVTQTKWSDKKLIDGSYEDEANALTFQTGADFGETTSLSGLLNMHALNMSLLRGEVTAVTAANATVSAITAGTGFTSGDFTIAAHAVASGVVELAGGTYNLSVTITQATDAGPFAYSAQLYASDGTTAVAGALQTGVYNNATGATDNVVTFANGLTVNLGEAVGEAILGTSDEVSRSATGTLTGDMTVDVSSTNAAISGELASGTDYFITLSYTATSVTATLMKDNGAATDTTLVGTTVAYATDTGAQNIDFGNGIVLDIAGTEGPADVEGTDGGFITYIQHADAVTEAQDGIKAMTGSFAFTHSIAEVLHQREGVNIREDEVTSTAGVTTYTSKAADFAAYMQLIDAAMVDVNSQLSKIGSLTGSLTFKEDQISSSQINVEASYNRIMNANMAEEQVNASKLLILQQTSTAMLAQANAAPQFLLSLFQ